MYSHVYIYIYTSVYLPGFCIVCAILFCGNLAGLIAQSGSRSNLVFRCLLFAGWQACSTLRCTSSSFEKVLCLDGKSCKLTVLKQMTNENTMSLMFIICTRYLVPSIWHQVP